MPSTGIYNGTLFRVYSGSSTIANATEGSISFATEMRERTTKDSGSGGYREVSPGVKSGTITCNALHAEDAAYGLIDLTTAWLNGTALTIKYSTEVTGDRFYSASCYISALEATSPAEEDMTFSVTFEINGTITHGTVA